MIKVRIEYQKSEEELLSEFKEFLEYDAEEGIAKIDKEDGIPYLGWKEEEFEELESASRYVSAQDEKYEGKLNYTIFYIGLTNDEEEGDEEEEDSIAPENP